MIRFHARGEFIFHSTDAGQTWSVQETPSHHINDLVFVNATTGWAGASSLLKTSTAGIK